MVARKPVKLPSETYFNAILDGIQQKSELEEKFKEEQKAITALSTEMRYVNAERREAIMLEMQQHGLTMSDISEQMSQIDAFVYSAPTATLARSNSRTTSELPHVEKSDIMAMAYQNYGMTKEYQEVIK